MEQKTNINLLMAYQYRDELGWSIIPVGTDKIATIAWKPFQTRLAADAEIESWWGNNPDWGIAVVTGKLSNLVVVDVDSYKPGGATYPLEPGETEVPWTVTSRTCQGGTHYFFRFPQNIDVRNSESKIAMNVDVRGEGGYAVLPPSKCLGGEYTWINAPYGLNAVWKSLNYVSSATRSLCEEK